MDQLIEEYDVNVRRVNELAINSLINVQIPVVNTLSCLPRYQLIQILHNIKNKCKDTSLSQQCFFLTLLTDVLTCMIKYDDFYDNFKGSNSYIVNLLCDKIKHLPKIKIEEFYQILKYTNRIPDYPELKICLNHIQAFNSAKHPDVSNSLTNIPTINNNTIVDTPERFLTTKGMYTGETKHNNRKENIENINKTKLFNLEVDNNEISPYNVEVKFIQNKIKLVKMPEKKPKAKLETKTNVKLPQIKPKVNLTEVKPKLPLIKPKINLTEVKPNNKLTEIKFNVNLLEIKPNVNLTETKLNVNSTEIKPKELETGKRRNAFEVLMSAAKNKKMKLF